VKKATEQPFILKFQKIKIMASINITNRETIPGTQYPIQKITFQKPDLEGQLHGQVNEVYFRPDAVAVLLADPVNQTLLLVRQFRLPAFLNGSDKGYLVETCAGMIDEGETAEQAARREVLEETGYAVTELEKIGGVYTSAGGITEFVHLFTATYNRNGDHEQGGGKEDEGEDIELVEISFNDARDQLKQAEVRDAKTMLLLQHYLMNDRAVEA
jgi:GDP-mannose pyrophosphatase NudK